MPTTPISNSIQRSSLDLDSAPRNKGEELYQRGLKKKAQKEAHVKSEKEKEEEEENKELTFKPKISHAAAAISRNPDLYSASLEWKKNLDKKLEEERAKKESQELAELNKKFQPNRMSQVLAQKIEHEGPVKGWSKHFEEYVEKRTESLPNRNEFIPHINEVSAAIERDEPVHDRLYRDALEHKERLEEFKKFVEEEMSKTDRSSPRHHHSEESVRRYDIGTALFLDAQEKEQRKKERQEQALAEIPFRPSISERSARIAETMPNRKPLYCPPPEGSTHHRSEGSGGSSSPPPRPSSTTIHPAMDNFLKRNQQMHENIAARREQRQRLVEEERMQECTFSPAICKKSVELTQTTGIYVIPGQSDEIRYSDVFSKSGTNGDLFKSFSHEENAGKLFKGLVKPSTPDGGKSNGGPFVRGQEQTGGGTPRKGQTFHVSLYEREKEKRMKKQAELEKAKQLAEEETMRACTFQPATLSGSRALNTSTSSPRSGISRHSPKSKAPASASLMSPKTPKQPTSFSTLQPIEVPQTLNNSADEVNTTLFELEKYLTTQGVEIANPTTPTSSQKQSSVPVQLTPARPQSAQARQSPAVQLSEPPKRPATASGRSQPTPKAGSAPLPSMSNPPADSIDSLEADVRNALAEWSFGID